jgi:hypothetical protein
MGNRVVRLGRNNQAKRLQIGGYIELALAVVAREHFTKIDSSSLWRDCPQNISEVLTAIVPRRSEMRQFRTDCKASRFPVNFRVTADFGHQVRTSQIHCGRTPAMPIIYGLGGAGKHVYSKNSNLVVLWRGGVMFCPLRRSRFAGLCRRCRIILCRKSYCRKC